MYTKKNWLVFCLVTLIISSLVFSLVHAETVIDTIDLGWPSGIDPGAVAVNEDTNRIYVANANHTVSVVDGATNTLVTTIPVLQGHAVVNTDDSDLSIDLSSENNRFVFASLGLNAISVVDTTTHMEIAQIPVGSRPECVEYFDNNNRIYVCNAGDATVTVINGSTLAVESTITVGTQPVAIGIFGLKLYVTNEGSHTVSIIEGEPTSPQFNTVIATIPLPGGFAPIGIRDSETTHKLYVANASSHNVSVLDGNTNSFIKNITLPGFGASAWLLINDATNYIYVLNIVEDNSSVFVINGNTDSVVATIPVGDVTDWPESMTINKTTHRVYVSHNDSVSVIDGDPLSVNFNSVIATIRPGWVPYAITVNEITNQVYVGVEDMDGLSVIDGSTNSLTTIVELGGGPWELSVDDLHNQIYVSNSNTNNMRINGFTHDITYFPAGPFNFELAVNGATNWAYYTNDWTSTIRAVNGATLDVSLIPVAADHALEDVAINSLTNRIYVSSGHKGIFIIDGIPASPQFNTVIATINTLDPCAMAINENTNLIYVTNGDDGGETSVTVIDGATNLVLTIITVDGQDPEAVVVNTSTNRIYVANSDGGTVSVIDGDSASITFNQVIATVPLIGDPELLAVNTVTNRIYIGYDEIGYGVISVINGATHAVEANITLPHVILEHPAALEINESQQKVYVLDGENQSVYIVDGNPSSITFNEVIQTLPVGKDPDDLVINETTGRVYVANRYSNSITVLSTEEPCEVDFNGDMDVDGSDLAIFAADFRRTDCATAPPCKDNFDGDNDMDGSDLAVFAADFGRTDCP